MTLIKLLALDLWTLCCMGITKSHH